MKNPKPNVLPLANVGDVVDEVAALAHGQRLRANSSPKSSKMIRSMRTKRKKTTNPSP